MNCRAGAPWLSVVPVVAPPSGFTLAVATGQRAVRSRGGEPARFTAASEATLAALIAAAAEAA